MTWRRFLVLLKGLGPNSAYVLTLQAKGNGKNEAATITDQEVAEREVWRLLG